MEIPAVKRNWEAGNKNDETQYACNQHPSQPILNLEKPNEKSEVEEERNQAGTDLFALTSKLFSLGERAKQLEEFFGSESLWLLEKNEQQLLAKSYLNSVLSEVLNTSVSILSQCEILNNPQKPPKEEEKEKVEIVEMKEDDILAEHVHLCKICGKGFKRDGNVRIHMRSHGNQYKTQEALKAHREKPTKSQFACPISDCRRNRGHPDFRPLKSVVCLRNHYRRSHCAKMYSCNKCGKEFSFVSDLKTHGNKCGISSWICSCNSMFPSKNKLFRHVAKFMEGHKPVLLSHTSSAVAAPPIEEKPTGSANSLDCGAQDDCNLAPEGLCNLAEGPNGYGSDEDLFMFDKDTVGMQQSEYMGQESQFAFLYEYGEQKESYGSLLWSDADLLWP